MKMPLKPSMPVIAVIMAAAMAAPIASRGPALFVAAPFCVFVMNAKTKIVFLS